MRPRFIGGSRANSRIVGGATSTQRFRAAKSRARLNGRATLRVDLASIVSKYIAETERNIRQLLDKAEQTHAILYFDEADALFGSAGTEDESIQKKAKRSRRAIVSHARRRGIPVVTGRTSTRLHRPAAAATTETPDEED